MDIINRILNQEFNGVFIDSRTPIEGGLFVPIRGDKFNGNSFIRHAFEGGARASLVEATYYSENEHLLQDLDLIVVEDSLQALQYLAHEIRQAINPTVIGITGSNGKTTLKNMLEAICRTSFRTHATKGNFNNEIGLPLMVLNMPPDTEMLVLEMGMSSPGEIALLSKITRPDIAVITNIGTSHLEFFNDVTGILHAKLEITSHMAPEDPLYINDDDPLLHGYDYGDRPVIRCRRDQLHDITSHDGYYSYRWQDIEVDLSVRGEHQVDNSHLAIAIGRDLGIEPSLIKQAISAYSGADMRFATRLIGDITVINDAYNASPSSMIAALKTMLDMSGRRKIAVLGDIFELGQAAQQEHRQVGQFGDIDKLDGLFTIGEFARYIAPKHPAGRHFTNIQRLCEHLIQYVQPGDLILVKASRGMQLERVVRYLEENYGK